MRFRNFTLVLFGLLLLARVGRAADVATVSDLRAAIESAQPGTTIHLAKGLWKVGSSIATKIAGTADKPITITADSAAGARLDFSGDEGLVVAHAYWIVEKVWLNGNCGGCASAGLHIQPGADHLIVRYCRITNFATGIKAERTATAEVSDVRMQGNELYNEAAERAAGGTPLDIVGGQRWLVNGNYIHDYSGTGMHAGLSLRGGAASAIIEQNLIAGAKTLAAAGSATGLSLGGAGTPADVCAPDNRAATSCNCEVAMGMVRNNIIAHAGGAGLAGNRACGTKVENNNVYDTTPGFQVTTAGPTGTLDVRYNVFSGALVGVPAAMNIANMTAANYKTTYLDPDNLDFYTGPDDKLVNDLSAGNPDVPLDYTGLPRKATNDWGAMELPATIHTWPWAGAAMIGTGPVPTMEIPAGSADGGVMGDAAAGAGGGSGGDHDASSAGGAAGSGAGDAAGNSGQGSGGAAAGATGGAGGGGSMPPASSNSGGGCSTVRAPVRSGAATALLALILGCALLLTASRRR